MKNLIRPSSKVPYDLVFFGVLMILSGFVDAYIIIINPDYRLPVFGMKLSGKIGWYFNFLFPLFHFASGYGTLLGKRWAYLLFMVFSIYMISSASIGLIRLPPPHNIRTGFLIGTPLFMGYLYWRRAFFSS